MNRLGMSALKYMFPGPIPSQQNQNFQESKQGTIFYPYSSVKLTPSRFGSYIGQDLSVPSDSYLVPAGLKQKGNLSILVNKKSNKSDGFRHS